MLVGPMRRTLTYRKLLQDLDGWRISGELLVFWMKADLRKLDVF